MLMIYDMYYCMWLSICSDIPGLVWLICILLHGLRIWNYNDIEIRDHDHLFFNKT